MATKTNKSYTKRLKLTKTGKIIGRTAGISHFNAKQSRVKQLNAKKGQAFAMTAKNIAQFIPHR